MKSSAFKTNSAYKCLVEFNDGNKRSFFSRDMRNSKSNRYHPELGLIRLKRMLVKFGAAVKIGIIYDNRLPFDRNIVTVFKNCNWLLESEQNKLYHKKTEASYV